MNNTPEQGAATRNLPVDPQLSFGERPVIEFVPASNGHSPKLVITAHNGHNGQQP